MNVATFSFPILVMLCSCESNSLEAISKAEPPKITLQDTSLIDNLETFFADTTPVPFPFEDFDIPLADSVSYSIRKQQAEALRVDLARSYYAHEIDIDSVSTAFEHFLIQNIFPHWYGTPWDFEGHTNTPKTGEVACGYFVSTTLRHMNIQINRYHLAQQASSNGAKSIAIDFDNISTYQNISDFENIIEDGLYSVGLSNHVGFLLKRNNELFFIHSDYIDMEVRPELATNSDALQYSTIFVIVRIGNQELMKKWLTKETVRVYRQ